MEKILICVLFGIVFVNLIVSVCLISKRREKDRQTRAKLSALRKTLGEQEVRISKDEADLATLRGEVRAQEERARKSASEIFLEINRKSAELSEKINVLEEKVRKSFENAASHVTGIDKKLNESSEALQGEINAIKDLLQEQRENGAAEAEAYSRAIDGIQSKIEAIVADYKELRRQIENVTKIEEDSRRLNDDVDEAQQASLIEAIVSKIKADKEAQSAEPKEGGVSLTAVEESTSDDLAVSDGGDEREHLPKEAEAVASNGDHLSPAKAAEADADGESEVRLIPYGNGISLDEEQARALDCMENTAGNYFITGKAGTGKSFLLKVFQSLTQKTILKVAPTGIAALNIEGVTIHSAFGYRNLSNQSIENLTEDTISLSPNKRLVLKNMDVLIIDEISMVSADIFDKIDKILRIVCKKEDRPFGGKQVLVFGDLFQLPPVVGREEEKYLKNKYGGIFFFDSAAYKNSGFSYVELRTNHRQKSDRKFFEILNKIREGSVTADDIALINERYVEDPDDLRRVIKLYPKKSLADRVNEDELKKILGEERVYSAEITYNGNTDQTPSLENNFQISTDLKLKIGAMVMMTRNDPSYRWVNGTLGIVEKFGADTVFVRINGVSYEINKADFEMNEATYKDGSITYKPILKVVQFPMILAYAITIHKSQGSTYQQIACDPSDCFAPGQAYVALSRCVDLQGVHLLKRLGRADVKVDSRVREFYLSVSGAKKAAGRA